MSNTIFHSDDYGMSVDSSKYILSCCDNGVLNSVAVMPNGPVLAECGQLLKPYVEQGKIQISVHLNLVEGKALCSHAELPILTDENNYFCRSFFMLFLLTLSPRRKAVKAEIKKELTRQICQVRDMFPGVSLALDSHQHVHMIPLIFGTMLEIVQELSLSLRYVRLACEPILPFITTPSLYLQIKPINIIKNMLLNLFGLWDRPRLQKDHIPFNLFWGLMFSGNMNLSVVKTLLPKFQKIADHRGLPLEILSHPCPITDQNDCLAPDKKEFVSFYFSRGRYDEAAMLKNIDG